jgi:outer membrane protein TolC
LTLLLGRSQQTQAQEQTALSRLSQLLGSPVEAQALAAALSAPQAIPPSVQGLLELAQAQSPGVLKLQAQARGAQAEISTAKADLLPEVYLRA